MKYYYKIQYVSENIFFWSFVIMSWSWQIHFTLCSTGVRIDTFIIIQYCNVGVPSSSEQSSNDNSQHSRVPNKISHLPHFLDKFFSPFNIIYCYYEKCTSTCLEIFDNSSLWEVLLGSRGCFVRYSSSLLQFFFPVFASDYAEQKEQVRTFTTWNNRSCVLCLRRCEWLFFVLFFFELSFYDVI